MKQLWSELGIVGKVGLTMFLVGASLNIILKLSYVIEGR